MGVRAQEPLDPGKVLQAPSGGCFWEDRLGGTGES